MQTKHKPKHKIIHIVVMEGHNEPENKVACLWQRGKWDVDFYDEAYYHFLPSDLKGVEKKPKDFELFTLLDYKIIGDWI